MEIAILSGKGGTGKTTLSTNLAAVYNSLTLIDCDVEEPNCHIFVNRNISEEKDVSLSYPLIDDEKCLNCGQCAAFCNYNAIISGKIATIVMKELCHDCGGCALVCPHKAITFEQRKIGTVLEGENFFYGRLDTGELSGVRIIDRVRETVKNRNLVLIDSPPGTSCSTVAAVEGCDYALIVTEPTPFGVSDMKMVVEMLRSMAIPFSVVVNKSGLGDDEIFNYCEEEELDILGEIPYSRSIAEAYATGSTAVEGDENLSGLFLDILEKTLEKAGMLV